LKNNIKGKNMINKMKVVVPALSKNEGFCRSLVAAFCVELSPTIEEVNDIKTAVSEAVTNAIVHGYEGQNGDIVIEAELYNDSVKISVTDFGQGIENIDEAMQPFFTTKPEEERSGMGFTVMQTFMNDIDVVSEKGKGTTVTMTKYFGKGQC